MHLLGGPPLTRREKVLSITCGILLAILVIVSSGEALRAKIHSKNTDADGLHRRQFSSIGLLGPIMGSQPAKAPAVPVVVAAPAAPASPAVAAAPAAPEALPAQQQSSGILGSILGGGGTSQAVPVAVVPVSPSPQEAGSSPQGVTSSNTGLLGGLSPILSPLLGSAGGVIPGVSPGGELANPAAVAGNTAATAPSSDAGLLGGVLNPILSPLLGLGNIASSPQIPAGNAAGAGTLSNGGLLSPILGDLGGGGAETVPSGVLSGNSAEPAAGGLLGGALNPILNPLGNIAPGLLGAANGQGSLPTTSEPGLLGGLTPVLNPVTSPLLGQQGSPGAGVLNGGLLGGLSPVLEPVGNVVGSVPQAASGLLGSVPEVIEVIPAGAGGLTGSGILPGVLPQPGNIIPSLALPPVPSVVGNLLNVTNHIAGQLTGAILNTTGSILDSIPLPLQDDIGNAVKGVLSTVNQTLSTAEGELNLPKVLAGAEAGISNVLQNNLANILCPVAAVGDIAATVGLIVCPGAMSSLSMTLATPLPTGPGVNPAVLSSMSLQQVAASATSIISKASEMANMVKAHVTDLICSGAMAEGAGPLPTYCTPTLGQVSPAPTSTGHTLPQQIFPGQSSPAPASTGQALPVQTPPGQSSPTPASAAHTLPAQVSPTQGPPGQPSPSPSSIGQALPVQGVPSQTTTSTPPNGQTPPAQASPGQSAQTQTPSANRQGIAPAGNSGAGSDGTHATQQDQNAPLVPYGGYQALPTTTSSSLCTTTTPGLPTPAVNSPPPSSPPTGPTGVATPPSTATPTPTPTPSPAPTTLPTPPIPSNLRGIAPVHVSPTTNTPSTLIPTVMQTRAPQNLAPTVAGPTVSPSTVTVPTLTISTTTVPVVTVSTITVPTVVVSVSTVPTVVVSTVTTPTVIVSTVTSVCPLPPPCPTCAACPTCSACPTQPTPTKPHGAQGIAPVGNGPTTTGPCDGDDGYTCSECIDGWFCPPKPTPMQSAPCGWGWPCAHCDGGWFCAPSPTPDSCALTRPLVITTTVTETTVAPSRGADDECASTLYEETTLVTGGLHQTPVVITLPLTTMTTTVPDYMWPVNTAVLSLPPADWEDIIADLLSAIGTQNGPLRPPSPADIAFANHAANNAGDQLPAPTAPNVMGMPPHPDFPPMGPGPVIAQPVPPAPTGLKMVRRLRRRSKEPTLNNGNNIEQEEDVLGDNGLPDRWE